MAKASDNVFPKVILGLNTSAPAAPSDSSWKVYSKAGGVFARSSNAEVGPFGTATGLSDPMTTRGDIIVRDASNVTARLAVGSSGKVLSSDGTDVSWQTPSSGAWTSTLSETGASFGNWANDIASHWSSNGTQFICNPGTATTGKARLTTALFKLPCRIDFEVYFDSTGTSEAGGSFCALGIGSSSNPSRGPIGGLRMVSNNPAANGQAYIEEQGQTGYNLATSTFALDTYIAVRIDIAASQTLTVTKSGTVIASESWNQNTGPYVLGSLIMIAYEAKVRVRNVVLYQL